MKKFARKDLVQLQCHGLVQDCSFSIDTKQKERDSWGAPIPGDGIQRGIKCEKETFTFVNMPNKKHFVGGANGPSAPERGSQPEEGTNNIHIHYPTHKLTHFELRG